MKEDMLLCANIVVVCIDIVREVAISKATSFCLLIKIPPLLIKICN